MNQFKPDTKVKLKIGGPEMTVKSIKIVCEWHDGNSIREETYDAKELENSEPTTQYGFKMQDTFPAPEGQNASFQQRVTS